MIEGEPFTARTRVKILCGLLLVSWSGCATYQFGTQTLYRPDIRTVFVPVFESDSFRRHLGPRLQEAVVKEIELKTPYKVVSEQEADSYLTGRIVAERKRPVGENRNDDVRDVEIRLFVRVLWQDRRGQLIGDPLNIPLMPGFLNVDQSVHFVPEAGQSITVAQHEAIERLAEQIVAQMEMPW